MFMVGGDGTIHVGKTAEMASEEKSEVAIFRNEREWWQAASHWPVKQLVAVWNRLPGVPEVKKFENKEIALRRIWRVLERGKKDCAREARKSAMSRVPGFREGSKASQVCALLSRPEGATFEAIRSATDGRRTACVASFRPAYGSKAVGCNPFAEKACGCID